MNFIAKIERLANQKTLILGLVITIVSLAAMQLLMSEILILTGGLQVMDLRFSYTVDDVGELLTAMGDTGRQLFSHMQIADTFFPLGMLLVMVNAIVSLTSRVFPEGSPHRAVVLIPFIETIFDYFENILNATQVADYPNLSSELITQASIMTSLKWSFVALTIGIIIILAIMAIMNSRRR